MSDYDPRDPRDGQRPGQQKPKGLTDESMNRYDSWEVEWTIDLAMGRMGNIWRNPYILDYIIVIIVHIIGVNPYVTVISMNGETYMGFYQL